MKRLSYQCDSIDDGSDYEPSVDNGDLVPTEDGNLISSLTDNGRWHMPVIDVDVPCRYVPSSTEGHGHLYFDVPMTKAQLMDLLEVMAHVGIVEDGYFHASEARGMSLVRKPGVKKVQS